MKELDYKFYSALRKGSIPLNEVSKSVKDSLQFQNLISSNVLETERSGRGLKVSIKNPSSFESFFAAHFSNDDLTEITKATNIKKLRNSKARKTESKPVFFLRGFGNLVVNDQLIDLAWYTSSFGLFGIQNPRLSAEKICFVENLESFLKAEKIFGDGFVFIHKYGRVGIDSLNSIRSSEVIVFVDFDFNGLDEYLRIKSVFENAKLFVPQDLDELFSRYSKIIDGKQKQSKRVIDSKLVEVIRIREMVSKTNRFLEQEILTYE